MNRIETNDLFKGAYLLSQSYRLKETRFVNSHQVRFVIEGENINEKDQLYHTGQALVDPLRLKECLNFLRATLTKTLKTHKPRNQYESNPRRGTQQD